MTKVLPLLFIGTFVGNVLWFLFQPLVERKRPVRLARAFLGLQGALFLVFGVGAGMQAGASWPGIAWGVCGAAMGGVELFVGLRGSDDAVLQLLFIGGES